MEWKRAQPLSAPTPSSPPVQPASSDIPERVGWLSPEYTRTLTVLGGQTAVLLKGPGEYTTLHIWLTVYQDRRYTLSIWPEAGGFPTGLVLGPHFEGGL